MGKQSIANKYAPVNTPNKGFIIENIELHVNTLFIIVLIYSSFHMFSYEILKIIVYSIFLLNLTINDEVNMGAICSHTAKLDHVKTVGFAS